MTTNGTGPRLSLPRVQVTLDDDRVEVVQLHNVDLLRWDRTAAKHGWPNFQDVRTWHATFCAWSALRREGRIPESWTWEEFSDTHALQVTAVGEDGEEITDDDAEVPVADPTLSGPVPG